MGWNAGGLGAMTFPSDEALARWRDTAPDARGLGPPPEELPDLGAALGTIREWIHAWSGRGGVRSVMREGLDVRLRFDVGEDAFRDEAWALACVLASAARHGARGRFVLLGTEGAEGDFALELALDDRRAHVRRLGAAEADATYRSDEYRALHQPLGGDALGGAPEKPSRTRTRAKKEAEEPVARIARLLGEPWKEKLAGASWRGVEEALHALRETRPAGAIPALSRWLDHPSADVSGTAAEVLLAYDAPEALHALADRCGTTLRHPTQASSGPRGYQRTSVLACFKLDPKGAYDRLLPLFGAVRASPGLDDPWVQAAFLVLSGSMTPGRTRVEPFVDLPKRDPRWLDLAYDLSELKGKRLALAGPGLLFEAGDPRAMRAYARGVRALGAPYVASYPSYRGFRGAPFLALATEPDFADIAPALEALAKQLG